MRKKLLVAALLNFSDDVYILNFVNIIFLRIACKHQGERTVAGNVAGCAEAVLQCEDSEH